MKTFLTMAVAASICLTWSGGAVRANRDLAAVQSWYQNYLGRTGRLIELKGWAGQLRSGVLPCEVEAGILGSDEYFHLHGCSPAGFVAGLYADVLGRQASFQEIQGWACRLGQRCTRTTLARDFLKAARLELAQRFADRS